MGERRCCSCRRRIRPASRFPRGSSALGRPRSPPAASRPASCRAEAGSRTSARRRGTTRCGCARRTRRRIARSCGAACASRGRGRSSATAAGTISTMRARTRWRGRRPRRRSRVGSRRPPPCAPPPCAGRASEPSLPRPGRRPRTPPRRRVARGTRRLRCRTRWRAARLRASACARCRGPPRCWWCRTPCAPSSATTRAAGRSTWCCPRVSRSSTRTASARASSKGPCACRPACALSARAASSTPCAGSRARGRSSTCRPTSC